MVPVLLGPPDGPLELLRLLLPVVLLNDGDVVLVTVLEGREGGGVMDGVLSLTSVGSWDMVFLVRLWDIGIC